MEHADTEYQWRQSMEAYAGDLAMPVDAVATADVLATLTPIWDEMRPTAARSSGGFPQSQWAIAEGHRSDNPVSAVEAVLPKNGRKGTEHRKALPYAEVPRAITNVEASTATPPTSLATPSTAKRKG